MFCFGGLLLQTYGMVFCYLLNAVSAKFARLNLPPPCACLSPTVERPEFL